jgi:hypothetical protein
MYISHKKLFKIHEVGWHSNANRYDLLTQEGNIHLFICTYVDWIMMFSIQTPLVKDCLKYTNMVDWFILGEQFHERRKILDMCLLAATMLVVPT